MPDGKYLWPVITVHDSSSRLQPFGNEHLVSACTETNAPQSAPPSPLTSLLQ
jgi:hypothetical protein